MRWRDYLEPLLWCLVLVLTVWVSSRNPMGWGIEFKTESSAKPAPSVSATTEVPRAKGARPGTTDVNWHDPARRHEVAAPLL